MIEKVERFHCKSCDFITENPDTVKRIKEGGKCPACSGGSHQEWTDTKEVK